MLSLFRALGVLRGGRSSREVNVVGSAESAARIGLLYGFAAYGLWGLVAVYFKAVGIVPPREILAHRIVWSALFLLLILAATNRLRPLLAVFRSGKALGM